MPAGRAAPYCSRCCSPPLWVAEEGESVEVGGGWRKEGPPMTSPRQRTTARTWMFLVAMETAWMSSRAVVVVALAAAV